MKKMTGKVSAGRQNYLSFMFIPHKSGNVRTIRISNYRTTLLTATAIMLVALLMLTGYTISVVKQNKTLKELHAKELQEIMDEKLRLEEFIANQTQQLVEGNELISAAASTKTLSDDIVNEIKSKYEEMVVSYVDKNVSTIKTISRGGSKEKSFKESLADLRALIETVESAKLAEDDLSSKIAKKQTELTNYLNSLPTYWPIDSMESPASGFGRRLHPIYKKYLTHEGIDIGSKLGSPIYAAGAGKVILAGWNGGYGKCVVIEHGNGFKSVYGHLSAINVKVGDWVKKGQQIAKMGNTGTSTSAHLHFEVRINDVPVNPLEYLEKR
ncbi:MAG: M23 family metallopeptidase [Clostridiaceae bacterium]|nr:M23 family metallopeptidase [Clostridiaceae bacterium]